MSRIDNEDPDTQSGWRCIYRCLTEVFFFLVSDVQLSIRFDSAGIMIDVVVRRTEQWAYKAFTGSLSAWSACRMKDYSNLFLQKATEIYSPRQFFAQSVPVILRSALECNLIAIVDDRWIGSTEFIQRKFDRTPIK